MAGYSYDNSTIHFFDQLAPKYDELTRVPGAWTPLKHLDEACEALCLAPRSVHDVGTGTGQAVGLLRRRYPKARISASDPSEEMLAIARNKYKDVDFLQGSSVDALQGQGKFDLITCVGAAEFFPDLTAFLEACRLSLTEGGVLLLTYEPQVFGSGLSQEQHVQHVSADSSQRKGFTVYRYTPQEANQKFTRVGFQLTHDVEFVAYRRGNHPVVYHLVGASL